jgi:hypothetical protein
MKADFKTNVMRILDKEKIEYTAHEYPHGNEAVDGLTVATLLGEDPNCVFKTLVTQGDSRNYFVFVVPVGCELDLKKCAKSVGEKNVEMILDDQNYIDFQVNSMLRTRRPMRLRMLLDEFPKRENRTTRVRMSTEFINQDILRVTVRDMGFGDLVSTSGKEITEEIDLSESSSS